MIAAATEADATFVAAVLLVVLGAPVALVALIALLIDRNQEDQP